MYELWGHKFGLLWPTSGCAGTYLASCWSHLAPHKVVLGHILPYVAQHMVMLEQTWPFSALIIPGCGKLRGILTMHSNENEMKVKLLVLNSILLTMFMTVQLMSITIENEFALVEYMWHIIPCMHFHVLPMSFVNSFHFRASVRDSR